MIGHMHGQMPMDWMGGMGGWMWLWALVGIAVWVSLIVLAVWAIRRFTDRPGGGGARRILEERFARGEIDGDEFRTRLGVLQVDRR